MTRMRIRIVLFASLSIAIATQLIAQIWRPIQDPITFWEVMATRPLCMILAGFTAYRLSIDKGRLLKRITLIVLFLPVFGNGIAPVVAFGIIKMPFEPKHIIPTILLCIPFLFYLIIVVFETFQLVKRKSLSS